MNDAFRICGEGDTNLVLGLYIGYRPIYSEGRAAAGGLEGEAPKVL